MRLKEKLNIYVVFVFILTIIGFILRVINLSDLSIWVDEYIHINIAKDFINGESSLYISGGENNGILLTTIISVFFKFFSSDPFWARFPSVLFGTMSIYLVYLLGKRLYGRYVGLIAAFLNVFSLFLIYWSRLARNYSVFEFSFLLFLIVLWNVLEPKSIKSKLKLFKTLNTDLKSIVFLSLVFLISFLSHQLTFFVVFGLAVYVGIMGIRTIILKEYGLNRFKYLYLGIPLFIISVLVFIPFLSEGIKSILGIMLPEKVVAWVVPNWDRLSALHAESSLKTFRLYGDVFRYDLKIPLLIIAMLGLILGFIKQFKPTLYISSFLIVPFLLMSFIFREPALPRYVIFLLPLAHLLVGLFFYNVYHLFFKRIHFFEIRYLKYILIIAPFVLISTQFRSKEIKGLVNVDHKVGYIVNKKISTWSFSNYADPCKFVLKHLQPNDLIFATHKASADYYLDRKDVILFRQLYYNTQKNKYEFYKTDLKNIYTGQSLANIIYLYQRNNRGWLITDYYFDNVMTDMRAKTWVFKNFNYHPEATEDGSVMVFSWDKSKKIPGYQSMVEDIGKSKSKIASSDYSINVNLAKARSKLTVIVAAENIDSEKEAYIQLNNKHYISIPRNKKDGVELLTVEIDKQFLHDGKNTARFVYNVNIKKDKRKGFLIYNLKLVY